MSPVDLILADDGSETIDPLMPIVRLWNRGECRIVTGDHDGIGASLNRAVASLSRSEPWIYTTDDWLLTEPLGLRSPLRILQDYDCVRLGPIHPNLFCTTKFEQGTGWWLELHANLGGFVFATRPFLANPSMINRVGPFDESLDSYEVERRYSLRFAAAGCTCAAMNLAGPWEHIGEYEVGDQAVVRTFQNRKVGDYA